MLHMVTFLILQWQRWLTESTTGRPGTSYTYVCTYELLWLRTTGLGDFCSLQSVQNVPASKMGARTLLSRAESKSFEPRLLMWLGKDILTLFLLNPRRETSKLDFRVCCLVSCLCRRSGEHSEPACLSQGTLVKRMFRKTLILFTLHSPVVWLYRQI